MLINPENNLKFRAFLNNLYSKLKYMKKESRPEYRWSIVLDYILLKSLGDNILNRFLSKRIPDIVNYYMPIIQRS